MSKTDKIDAKIIAQFAAERKPDVPILSVLWSALFRSIGTAEKCEESEASSADEVA